MKYLSACLRKITIEGFSFPVLMVLLSIIILPIDHPNFNALHRLPHFFESFVKNGTFLGTNFFGKKIAFYLADIPLILAAFSLRKRSLWEGSAKYLSLLFLLLLISTIFSDRATYPLLYWRLLHNFLACIIFFVLAKVDSEKVIKHLLFVFVITGIFESLVGIAQYFMQHGIGLKALGESHLFYPSNIFHEGSIPSRGARWILDTLFGVSLNQTYLLRPAGTLPYATIFGGYIVFSIMASYYLFLKIKKSHQLLFAPFIFLQIFAVSISFSRSAEFAFLGASLIWFITAFIKMKEMNALKKLAIVFASSLLLSFILLYPQFIDRGGIVNYNEVTRQSDNGRIKYQAASFKMIKEKPFLGHGYNNFVVEIQKKVPIDFTRESGIVHNNYLLFATEGGLLALFAFLAFIFTLIFRFSKSSFSPLSLTLFSLLIGYLFICGCDFYPLTYQEGKLFYLIAGLLAASLNLKAQCGKECNIKPTCALSWLRD